MRGADRSGPRGSRAVWAAAARRRLGRWRPRVALVGCLASIAAGGGLLGPASASAYTNGFHVYNLSGTMLRLSGISGAGTAGQPSNGDYLEPGSWHDFEVIYYASGDNNTTASYDVLDDAGRVIGGFAAVMNVDADRNLSSSCSVSVSPFTCEAPRAQLINFLDAPGTVHDIPAGQGQAQAAVLKQLCTETSAATCTFTPTSERHVDSPSHQVGNALVNNTDEDQDTSIAISDAVGSSDSVGTKVSLEAKLGTIVKASIEASYDHEWTTEHTFRQTVDVHCPPHNKCTIMATAPMLRDTGDFTLTMANTTWHLRDVSFDSPDPSGNGAYEVDSQRLAGAQRASVARGSSAARRRPRIYRVPDSVARRPIVRPRLRVALVRSGSVRSGRTARYRVKLTRTRSDRRLEHTLQDVRVSATVRGRVVRRWRPGTLPRGHSRTLSFAVTAPRSGCFCVTVDATEKDAIGDRDRICTTKMRQRQRAPRQLG